MSRSDGVARSDIAWALGGYGLCLALVAAFACAFAPFQELTLRFGPAAAWAAPVLLLAAVAAAVAILAWRRAAPGRIGWGWLVLAALLAAGCLLFLDPRFPAKRIHVAEYMALSFAVAWVTRRWVRGARLVLWTAALTALFGLHDEMLQGLLPDRTFGLDELLVDALSGLAGAMILQGLRLVGAEEARPRPSPGLAATATGAVLFALALPSFRDMPLPIWTALPLLGGVLVWATEPSAGKAGLPAAAFAVLAMLLVAYPVLTHVLPLHFR